VLAKLVSQNLEGKDDAIALCAGSMDALWAM